MQNVKAPFVINMYYNMGDENGHTEYVWTTGKLPVDESIPKLGSFTFKNMECSGVGYCAAGEPDMRKKSVPLKNAGLDFHFVKKVLLKNVYFNGQDGDEILTEQVQSIVRN